MTLHHCGTENAADAKFCSDCGERLAAAARKSCSQCGFENDPAARFCVECGARLDANGAGASAAAFVPAVTEPSGRKRASSSWTRWVLGAALVAVLGVTGGWWFMSGIEAEEESVTAKSGSTRKASSTAAARSRERKGDGDAGQGKTALGARSPREVCADHNIITRHHCEAEKCRQPVYMKHPLCIDYRRVEEKREHERLYGNP